jgi:hypothetical protein
MNVAMDFLEFLCGLLEWAEVISILCDIIVWLFRAPFRLIRWIREPSGEPSGRLLSAEANSPRYSVEGRGIFHMSLTRRRRGKWRGASYVLR